MASKSSKRILTIFALTCFGAVATEINALADERTVTVCMESGVAHESGRAQVIAEQMFADIGVRIDWHKENKCPAELPGVIHIELTTGIPANRFPEGLAISLPYEGVHIQVFVDRIRKLIAPKIEPTLLAHVLAHEITHVLQGLSRHSESGVMKAKWDQRDYEKMAWKPLPFSEKDVMLIHFGLSARAAGKPKALINQLTANLAPAIAVQ